MTWENLRNRETSRNLSNFKFLGVICYKFWLKVKLIRKIEIFFSHKIYHKTTERSKNNYFITVFRGVSKNKMIEYFEKKSY